MNEFQPRPAGYAHLVRKHALVVPTLLHESLIDTVSQRLTKPSGETVEERFPQSYDPGDEDVEHLIFALKYDGVDLVVLRRLFVRETVRTELSQRITAQPGSKYLRRLVFLCERLTDGVLSIPDLSTSKVTYVPVLEPDEYFVADGHPLPRYRVIDNLLGDRGFCPVVRRTPELADASRRDFSRRAHEITASVDPLLLARAISYLYTKETRSSFAIEHEDIEPGTRMERFMAQLAAAGERPLVSESALTELQQSFVDPRYAEAGFRGGDAPEVYVGETIHWREKIHHVGARSASTPEIMAAWARMRPVSGIGGAVVEAACRSFAFVFIHPFGDGNGRIHRLLLHNVLALRGVFPPRLIVPISAVLLADPQGYDRALESFSRRVLPLVDYKLDMDGALTIRNDTDDLYRYPDLTVVCQSMFAWLERAVEEELVKELELPRRFDEARARMREIVEMPDRKEQLFLKLCMGNRGKLAARKRGLFAELGDDTVAALEAVVRDVMLEPAE